MTKRTKKFSVALEKLIDEGGQLQLAMQYECNNSLFDDQLNNADPDAEKVIQAFIKNLPNFKENYQTWYSESQAVIKQILPDRLTDFTSYYEYPRVRKDISFQNYMIRDYLQGLIITRGGGFQVIADSSAAIPEFT